MSEIWGAHLPDAMRHAPQRKAPRDLSLLRSAVGGVVTDVLLALIDEYLFGLPAILVTAGHGPEDTAYLERNELKITREYVNFSNFVEYGGISRLRSGSARGVRCTLYSKICCREDTEKEACPYAKTNEAPASGEKKCVGALYIQFFLPPGVRGIQIKARDGKVSMAKMEIDPGKRQPTKTSAAVRSDILRHCGPLGNDEQCAALIGPGAGHIRCIEVYVHYHNGNSFGIESIEAFWSTRRWLVAAKMEAARNVAELKELARDNAHIPPHSVKAMGNAAMEACIVAERLFRRWCPELYDTPDGKLAAEAKTFVLGIDGKLKVEGYRLIASPQWQFLLVNDAEEVRVALPPRTRGFSMKLETLVEEDRPTTLVVNYASGTRGAGARQTRKLKALGSVNVLAGRNTYIESVVINKMKSAQWGAANYLMTNVAVIYDTRDLIDPTGPHPRGLHV